MNSESQFGKPSNWGKKLRKLGLSALFLLVILCSIDTSEIIKVLSNLKFGTLLLISVTYFLGQMVSAMKWRMFLQYSGLSPSFTRTAKAYMLGMFVNSFAFGTVGGDVARALAVSNSAKQKDIPQSNNDRQRSAAIGTVLADRVHGLLVLLGISIIAIDHLKANIVREIAVELTIATLGAIVASWIIGPKILLKIFPSDSKFHEIAKKLSGAFPRKPAVIVPATLISALFHLSQIMIYAILAKELNLMLPLGYLVFFIPLVNIACSLPISFNGIGLRESLLIFFFARAGIPAEPAFAIGAIWITVVTVTSAICGLLVSAVIRNPNLEESLNSPNSDSFFCEEPGRRKLANLN